MTARPGAGGGAGVLGLVLLASSLALADDPLPAEVRVLSTPAPLPTTTVTVRAGPDTVIEDRTVGARPSAPGQGPASVGDTFRDEITLFLRGIATRPAVVDVADDLVSTVRVVPAETGTTVVIFVRQPLSYTVARPSAAGEIVIALKGRAPPPVPTPARPARGPRPPSPAVDKGQVAIDAAELTYDQERDTVIARGNVSITRGAVTLRADEVQYDRRTGVATATGNVVLTDPETTLRGDAGTINLTEESGWMERADAEFARSGFSLTSGRLSKGIGPRYRVDDGLFTTCRCGGLEKPSWSVGGRRTDVRLNGIGVVRGATFRVKDVPVLWVPVLPFPALTDRATGFLMPRFGYSNRRGFQYEQPFFWNISKSQDATLALDLETRARVGILGEYRYMLSRAARGAVAGGYWNESFRSPSADDVLTTTPQPEAPENRWLVLARATQPFVRQSQLYLDVFAVSDTTLLQEITNFGSIVDTNLGFRSARLTKSRAGGIKTWNGGLVQGEADYYQDLIDPQELAPQRAPQLRAEQSLPLLGNRLVGRLAGQVVNFQRIEGFDGFRGDVAPELFLPFQLWRAVQGSVTGRVHGTMYQLADDQQVAFAIPVPSGESPFRAVADADRLPLLDPTHLRGVGEVQARLGTELSRVFSFPYLGLAKLRHSIEPEVRYVYVPEVDEELFRVELCRDPRSGTVRPCRDIDFQSPQERAASTVRTLFSRGYLFDELDAINRRNFFSYGFSTRLLGRGAAPIDAPAPGPDAVSPPAPPPPAAVVPARELLRLGVRHGWDPSREIVPASHLANIDLGLRFTPLAYLALTYSASVSVAERSLDAQNVGLAFFEPNWAPPPRNPFQSPFTVGVTYRFVEANVNARGFPETSPDFLLLSNPGLREIASFVYLRLGDHAGFTFASRYDLNDATVFNQEGEARQVGPRFIERNYLFRLISRCNCWAAELGMSDRFDTDERLFRFQITLLGLGSFGQGTGGFSGFAPLRALGLRRPTALGGSYF